MVEVNEGSKAAQCTNWLGHSFYLPTKDSVYVICRTCGLRRKHK